MFCTFGYYQDWNSLLIAQLSLVHKENIQCTYITNETCVTIEQQFSVLNETKSVKHEVTNLQTNK